MAGPVKTRLSITLLHSSARDAGVEIWALWASLRVTTVTADEKVRVIGK